MMTEEEKNQARHPFEEKAESMYQPYSSDLFKKYGVKRGLRNDDGTGVLAGLSSVGSVVGYIIDDGEKTPIEGHLKYRGYDIVDIVKNAEKENRFGYEEVVYLLLFGELPDRDTLEKFTKLIGNI